MNSMDIQKYKSHKEDITLMLPSSKSISNRSLILAAQTKGCFEMKGDFHAEDVQLMIEALKALGIGIERTEQGLKIENDLSWKKNSDDLELFLGNSGTCVRFLSSLVPLRKGATVLTGNRRMKERPILDMADALSQLGVEVLYQEKDGFPPVKYSLKEQSNRKVIIKADTSSQYLSSLLLSSPSYPMGMSIALLGDMISKPYIDLSLDLLKKWGVIFREVEDHFVIDFQELNPTDMIIEGDASAAVYWWAFSFLHKSEVFFDNLDEQSLQGDMRFQYILQDLKKHKRGLFERDMNDMPDASMMLMALAPTLSFPVKITNIESLRVKESDRIDAMSTQLKRLGVDVKTGDDWIQIDSFGFTDPKDLITIETYDDHRIAMSFAILATKIGNLTINDPECVNKTYPNFWRDLEKITS